MWLVRGVEGMDDVNDDDDELDRGRGGRGSGEAYLIGVQLRTFEALCLETHGKDSMEPRKLYERLHWPLDGTRQDILQCIFLPSKESVPKRLGMPKVVRDHQLFSMASRTRHTRHSPTRLSTRLLIRKDNLAIRILYASRSHDLELQRSCRPRFQNHGPGAHFHGNRSEHQRETTKAMPRLRSLRLPRHRRNGRAGAGPAGPSGRRRCMNACLRRGEGRAGSGLLCLGSGDTLARIDWFIRLDSSRMSARVRV